MKCQLCQVYGGLLGMSDLGVCVVCMFVRMCVWYVRARACVRVCVCVCVCVEGQGMITVPR